MSGTFEDRLDRASLEGLQTDRLRSLLTAILPGNGFYANKFAGIQPSDIHSLDDLRRLPLTTKKELSADQAGYPPYGTVLTYPVRRYVRMHQTSGTAGQPLRWLDTPESWAWILACWETMFRIVGLRDGDRLFFAFSFGPFLGFWSAFEAASRLGYLCLPGGGMSSAARLRFLLDNQVTVVLCTPTYAMRLAEVAKEEGLDLAHSPVRALIVAGEPGGSVADTRVRMESAWGARVFDHCGMTESGALGIECPENPAGLHLLESACIAEVVDPQSLAQTKDGETGELVLTNLGRLGSPVIRYRTGDLVRVDPEPCPCGRALVRLAGGILGRVDDMIHVRGNNVYPTALEGVLRRFPELAEYQVLVDETGPLAEVIVTVEPTAGDGRELAERVSRAIRDEFLFRAQVKAAAPGSLPRFEMKARRLVRKLKTGS